MLRPRHLILCLGCLTAVVPQSVAEDRTPLTYSRYSGKLNVPDPVAISVADNGDVYVTQTQRRKIQDLDIRQNTQWIPDDVGFASVADKRAFYHRQLAIGGDQASAARHIQDVNGDGTYDWRDLTVISEKIHRLRDTDGDGLADQINVFAEDFKTEVTGIAAGVMHWNDSVWATIAPDVWKLTDTDDDGVADRREVMATGFGLHIAYAGHDMHGLTIGPDGKVYWSIGDKGISVTTREGRHIEYPNQGGVMRCNLDGSDFEVFAHGLRNVQEIAFDQFGNLFGVDNDADMPGEKERFVWIVDQMDAGWRCNYQYRGDAYNPWIDEKLWQKAGEDHPAYIVPPIEHSVDGPAGFKFNPGTALSADYRNFFFLTSAPNGSQYAFRATPHGDSFEMADAHKIGNGEPIVGIAFGPDGGLYGVDWGGGYPLNQTGSVIRIDVSAAMLSDEEKSDRKAVQRLLAAGVSETSTEELIDLLDHPDQRIRLRTQFALVARRDSEALQSVALDTDAGQLARLHSVWGLGQLIDAKVISSDVLVGLLSDTDAVIRCGVVKTLGETGTADSTQWIDLLRDRDLHVRVHAALAFGRVPSPEAVGPLFELIARCSDEQHYLRHAAITGLAACATPEQLASKTEDTSEQVRLGCVVGLRRQGSPLVAHYLSDRSNWVATEASRAIHDDQSIGDALEALAEALLSDKIRPQAMVLRCINANLRLGTEQAANRLIQFVADTQRDLGMRVAACDALSDWLAPPVLDRVDGRNRSVRGTGSNADRRYDSIAVAKLLSDLVSRGTSELRLAGVKASRRLAIELPEEALFALTSDADVPTALRLEALQGLLGDHSKVERSQQSRLLVELMNDRESQITSRAVTELGQVDPERAIVEIQELFPRSGVPVQQACVQTLGRIASDRADRVLADLADQWLNQTLSTGVKLDLYQVLVSRSDDSVVLRDHLRQIEALPRLSGLASTKVRQFALAEDGGEAERGEKLFRTDLRYQCIRCHRVGKGGSEIGPELTRIAEKRDRAHLLRAIVQPSADIEPKYNVQTILLDDGNVVQGIILSEDDREIVLLDAEGKEQRLPADSIEQIAEKKVSLMPDMTEILSARDLRDLVAYLATLKKQGDERH